MFLDIFASGLVEDGVIFDFGGGFGNESEDLARVEVAAFEEDELF